MSIIEVINLSKRYYSALPFNKPFRPTPRIDRDVAALDNINLSIKSGELFSLVGPNRSGKTTLIKILATLVTPTKGAVYIKGQDLSKDSFSIRKIINIVNTEERNFYWRLTGRENLYFFGKFYNLSLRQIKERVKELLELLEIKEPDVRFQEYSSGIKQRLAIARSLLNNPEIILMDEPTKSLDVLISDKIKSFIKEELIKKRGKTVVYVTHNIAEVLELSDRVGFLVGGRLKCCMNIEEVRSSRKENVRFLKDIFRG